MVVGLDYHNTITKDERFFKRFAILLREAGVPVYIVSALKNPCDPKRKKEVERCSVSNDGVELVYFKDFGEIAELKLEVCKRLHITHFFDDMESVAKHLARNGIVTMQVR